MSRFLKNATFPILIVVVLAFFAQRFLGQHENKPKPNFGQFLTQVKSGDVKSVTVNTRDNTLNVTESDGKTKYETGYPDNYEPQLIDTLQKNNVEVSVKGKGGSNWLSLLTYILPFVLLLAFWIFLMNSVQGGGSRVMSFGKSRAKRLSVDSPKVTFRDVAGVDEAVEELHEIKEFLENPKKFQALGARIPKGVLLYGPPGTGKTLLARAVAGEAVHRLHGRDRRRRPPSRRGPRRRPRRARADAEPAPRRDGRVRAEGQHHPDRGHEPARHPRP